jgi:uncharacterized protein (TIGR02246 family)
MKRWLCLALVWAACPAALVMAQEKKGAEEAPVHNELRKLRDEMVDAFNQRDVDRMLNLMHPDVVITWQNAEVSRKHAGVREYYERMLLNKDSVVERLTVDLEVDEFAILHGGDTAIAWGTLGDKYRLRDGSEFAMNSRWSATLVKQGDRWLIASAHGSVDAFRNEILRQAAGKLLFWSGGGGLVLGILLGIAGVLVLRRRKAAS